MRRRRKVRALRAGSYNLKVGRDPMRVRHEVAALLAAENLDVLAVQEAWQYDRQLARIVGYEYHTTRGKKPTHRDAGLLVRHGLDVRGYRLTRTRTTWPRTKAPGPHWPRSFPSVVVEGVRFVSVHMPPLAYGAGAPAYAEGWARLALLIGATLRPVVALGDWNKPPGDRRPFTPRALARTTRATVTGFGIDYLLARGVYVDGYRKHEHGHSDHKPFTFILTRG